MVEKCRKFSQTELDPETPQSTKSSNFAKLLISLFVAKSKVTFYQLSMCVKMKVAQSCPTLCDPVDYTVYGILQARILEWIVIPFSRGSSQPRNWTQVSCIASGVFTTWATRDCSTLCHPQLGDTQGDTSAWKSLEIVHSCLSSFFQHILCTKHLEYKNK